MRRPVPALYMAGDRDLVLSFRGIAQLLPALKQFVPESAGYDHSSWLWALDTARTTE
jgi:hypothetical protein